MGHLLDVARRVAARFTPLLQCGACGRAKGDAVRLIAGPGTYLCEVCIRAAMARLAESVTSAGAPAPCRFCGHLRPPVPDAATVDVCAPCIRLMDTILAEDDQRRQPAT